MKKPKLKKYLVLITAEMSAHTWVDVAGAKNKKQAVKNALEEADKHPERFTWTLDDGFPPHDVYVADEAHPQVEEVT